MTFLLVAVMSLVTLVIVPEHARAATAILNRSLVEFQYGGAVEGVAIAYQDPSTRNVWVTLSPSPSFGFTVDFSGPSGSCGALSDGYAEFYAEPAPPGDIKINLSAAPTENRVAGTGGWCDQSSTSGTDQYVQVEAYNGGVELQISATWQQISFAPDLALVVATQWGVTSKSVGLLPPAGTLKGTFTDSNGLGVVGATVRAQSPARMYTTTTGSGGFYTFAGMLPDTYTVTVPGCAPQGSVTVPDANVTAAAWYNVSVYRTGTLYGYVNDRAGSPIATATVLEDTCNGQTITNAQGYYSLSVPAGSQITVWALKPYYMQVDAYVTVPAGGSIQQNFVTFYCGTHCPTKPSG